MATLSINSLPRNPDFLRPWARSLLKTLWEKENAGYQDFLLFPQCFQPNQ